MTKLLASAMELDNLFQGLHRTLCSLNVFKDLISESLHNERSYSATKTTKWSFPF